MTCFLFLLVIEYNLTGQGMDRCYDFESSASAAGPDTLLRAGFTTCDSPVFEKIYIYIKSTIFLMFFFSLFFFFEYFYLIFMSPFSSVTWYYSW